MASNHSSDDASHSVELYCHKAIDGDGDALEALLCMHHRQLSAHLRRKIGVQWQGKIDVEDILQEAYLQAFASIREFRWQGDDSFYHWVTRLADHCFFHQVRRLRTKKRSVERETRRGKNASTAYQSLLAQCAGSIDSPSRIMRRADAIGALMGCLARLPEDYRIAIQRLHLSEDPISSVAADMGRSEDAVRRLASRAVQQLSTCMGRASRYLSDAR